MFSLEPTADILSQCIEDSMHSLPSEAVIGMRLLSQRDRLTDAFYEIATKLGSDTQRRTFFGLGVDHARSAMAA